jgi:hypothetical protein
MPADKVKQLLHAVWCDNVAQGKQSANGIQGLRPLTSSAASSARLAAAFTSSCAFAAAASNRDISVSNLWLAPLQGLT